MKDEFGGVVADEFVELKSKMFSIKKFAAEFNEFKDVLFNKKIIRHKIKRIQSKKHKLGTFETAKISLSCFDEKRFVLDDEINTLAYFHKNSVTGCKEIKKDCDN